MREVKKEFQRNSQRDEKGITLVALVITIVILIILAVVTINFTFGDNGLIRYAEDARDYQSNADAMDSKLLNDATEYIDGIVNGNGSGGGSTEQTATTVEEAKENGLPYKDTTVINDDLNNEVTIPGGFNIANDSGTKIEEGIVIEDEIGNQFVWIPTGTYQTTSGEKTNNLSRRSWADENVVAQPNEVNGDEVVNNHFYGEGNENSVAKDQIEGFKASANSNKGFYIGRYEAGTEIERTSAGDSLTTPLVQANKNAYVNITRNQAKEQSEGMYNGNSYVTSELISSYAWDTALNFICQNSEEGYLLATTIDSTYGNLGTGTTEKELTGVYEADNYSNIHDLLGNCREWTTECYDDGYSCVPRGGFRDGNFSAANRNNVMNTDYSGTIVSFRIQLYIK